MTDADGRRRLGGDRTARPRSSAGDGTHDHRRVARRRPRGDRGSGQARGKKAAIPAPRSDRPGPGPGARDSLVQEPATTSGGPLGAGRGDTLLLRPPPSRRQPATAWPNGRSPREDKGEVAWCAERREGWSNPTALPRRRGVDDLRRPPAGLLPQPGETGGHRPPTPVDGTPELCTGSERSATSDGAVWSTVPNERQIERGDFFARAGEATYDLGPGVNDTRPGAVTRPGSPATRPAASPRSCSAGRPTRRSRWPTRHPGPR